MKYTSEEISACKKKIHLTVEAAEIQAAIDAAVALQQKSVALAGFRKGHVPANIVEKRFKGQLYHDACTDLINVHINTVLSEMKLKVLGGVTPENITSFERGKDMEYDLVFEHLPVFDLPDYEGLEVEQEEAVAKDAECDAMIARLLEGYAEFKPVEGNGPATVGQYVNIDLKVVCDGEEKPAIAQEGADLLLGQAYNIPPLEELASSLTLGETGSRPFTFPEDFSNKDVAGKATTITVTLHAIKERKVPELTEEFAQAKMHSDLAGVRDKVREIVKAGKTTEFRAAAQVELLNRVMKLVDFDLPESLVEKNLTTLLAHEQTRAERIGKKLSDEQLAALKEQNLPSARLDTKRYIILSAIAQKEGLEVSNEEVEREIAAVARQYRADYQAVYNYYRETGLIFEIRDRIFADKGADALYAKAKVIMVPEKTVAPTEEKAAE